MAKVLVTGAAGFIGSAIARELLARGHEVSGIDNLSTGRLSNLSDVLSSMSFIQGDHCDQELLRELCRGTEVVFHQGALASVPHSVSDLHGSHQINVNGTVNVLLAARDAGVRRVVYASSSAVYGDAPSLPKSELMPPAPISPYAVQKLTGELYMQTFAQIYNIETVCLRYFNVFGPRQSADSPYSGVLARFITLMIAGIRPTIFADGSQSRDFTFIDDVVKANMLAAEAPASKASGNVFNIACGVSQSLLQTYEMIAGLTGFNKPPLFAAARTGDIQHSLADISRAASVLGYKPAVSFLAGLSRTLEWYRCAEQFDLVG